MKGVFWLLLITVACGVAVYWFGFSDDSPLRWNAGSETSEVHSQAEPSVPLQPDTQAPESVPESASDAPEVEPAPRIIIDSFAPSERMPLDSWTLTSEASGHFDVFNRSGDGAGVEESLLIEPTDILVAQGWAGNYALGLQFKDVLLSACGQIVARAQVGRLRPDVAEAIHPNLGPSGWTAQVLAGDLPFCADSQIRGWAIAPGASAILAPLVGAFAYVPPAQAETPNRLSAQQAVSPLTYPKPRFEFVNVTASKANLRKCGSTSCDVTGQIAQGRHFAHIATRGEEWSLVLLPGNAGWLFNDLFEIAP